MLIVPQKSIHLKGDPLKTLISKHMDIKFYIFYLSFSASMHSHYWFRIRSFGPNSIEPTKHMT